MKEGTLFFIAVVKSEASPMLAMEFIAKLNSLLRAYIGVVNETKLRSNFSMVYQVSSMGWRLRDSFWMKWLIMVCL